MFRILLLSFLLVFTNAPQLVRAQKSVLSDYALEQIKDIPEANQDSFYLVQAKYYYAFYTRESYRKSMECYLEALRIAIQYKHPAQTLQCYFGIGSVYDANNNLPKAVYYYKLYYNGVLNERPFNSEKIIRATYNIAATYTKAKDTTQGFLYTLKMTEMLSWLKNPTMRNNYCLLIAHNFIELGKQREFEEYYTKITPGTQFTDGELAYGRYFAEIKSKYAALQNDKEGIIPPILFELSRTRDSVPLMNLLIATYAQIGDYKNAYNAQQLMIAADMRSMDRNTYGDINYRLLEADNLLRQKKNSELEVTAQQLRLKTSLLYLSAVLLALAFAVTLYLFRRYKIKNKLFNQENELTLQHQDARHLLLEELHSGINESLLSLSDSLDMQFDAMADSNNYLKKEIKAGVKCIALSHTILQQNDKIKQVALQSYFEKLTEEVVEIFEVNKEDIYFKFLIKVSQMDVAKLIPLALTLVELLKNTFINTLNVVEQVEVSIACRLVDDEYHIVYEEAGAQLSSTASDSDANVLTVLDTKLIRKFLQHVDAKIMSNKNDLGLNEVTIVFNK